MEFIKVPWKRFIGIAVFLLICAILPWFKWSEGPAHLSWGVWLLCYASYVVLLVWSFWFAYSDSDEE